MLVSKVQPIKAVLGKNTIAHSVSGQAKFFKGIVITPEKLAAMKNGVNLHQQKVVYAGSTENCDSSYHGPNCASPEFCW